MISKDSVINYFYKISSEYNTEKTINQVKKDLEKVKSVAGMIISNKSEGYKEVLLVTTPDINLRYNLYKR